MSHITCQMSCFTSHMSQEGEGGGGGGGGGVEEVEGGGQAPGEAGDWGLEWGN